MRLDPQFWVLFAPMIAQMMILTLTEFYAWAVIPKIHLSLLQSESVLQAPDLSPELVAFGVAPLFTSTGVLSSAGVLTSTTVSMDTLETSGFLSTASAGLM